MAALSFPFSSSPRPQQALSPSPLLQHPLAPGSQVPGSLAQGRGPNHRVSVDPVPPQPVSPGRGSRRAAQPGPAGQPRLGSAASAQGSPEGAVAATPTRRSAGAQRHPAGSQDVGTPSGAAPLRRSQPTDKDHPLSRSLRIQACLALVEPIARHYARLSREQADDLTQVGLLGLMRAAERYVASTGLPFEPFARQHIRGAILHYLRDQAPLLRIPRRRQELELQRRRCTNRLEAETGLAPAPEAVRQAMGLSQAQWQRLEASPGSLRLVALDEAAEPMAENVESGEPDDPRGARAMAMLHQLPAQQAEAIRAVILAGRSLRQVAGDWNVSASTVHRQLHRGLAELRRLLEYPSDAAAC